MAVFEAQRFPGPPKISIFGESGGNRALYATAWHLLARFAEREAKRVFVRWQTILQELAVGDCSIGL